MALGGGVPLDSHDVSMKFGGNEAMTKRNKDFKLENYIASWWLVSTHLKNMRKSNWIHLPQIRGENKNHLKPPPSSSLFQEMLRK